MKKYFLLFFSFFIFIVQAQTGIGTSTPHASAKLEVASATQGFLPPRVALTATNSASPITNPANGLMVFNTATAGSSPYAVEPGYYFWDGNGQKWVSIAASIGNVQAQAVFRSTSNTTAGAAVSSWNSRFNNLSSGDLIVSSNTTFALSNGIYKLEWGLPHQQTNTYNAMQLQEYTSGVWNAWMNDGNLGNIANGGGTDWGGTTFMTDIIDCSASTRTLRFTNSDGYRNLYYGAFFTITKLNPSSTNSINSGSNGQVLTTNGSGVATWGTVPPTGVITAFAGSTAPSGYLLCDGSAVSRSTYANLYAVIGTTYGAGNGSTTFNLPDLTGRVPVGKNAGTFATLGSKGGEETHTMTVNEMPSHKHTTSVNSAVENTSIGGYAVGAQSMFFGTDRGGTTKNWDTAMQNTGGGAAFNVLQPYTVLNYIIKY